MNSSTLTLTRVNNNITRKPLLKSIKTEFCAKLEKKYFFFFLFQGLTWETSEVDLFQNNRNYQANSDLNHIYQ